MRGAIFPNRCLSALEALKAISKDPASKIYFMDGDSPSPLPLMNIGN